MATWGAGVPEDHSSVHWVYVREKKAPILLKSQLHWLLRA